MKSEVQSGAAAVKPRCQSIALHASTKGSYMSYMHHKHRQTRDLSALELVQQYSVRIATHALVDMWHGDM